MESEVVGRLECFENTGTAFENFIREMADALAPDVGKLIEALPCGHRKLCVGVNQQHAACEECDVERRQFLAGEKNAASDGEQFNLAVVHLASADTIVGSLKHFKLGNGDGVLILVEVDDGIGALAESGVARRERLALDVDWRVLGNEERAESHAEMRLAGCLLSEHVEQGKEIRLLENDVSEERCHYIGEAYLGVLSENGNHFGEVV